MTFHIIVATEKRQPTIIQTRKEYVGMIVEETCIDEDGDEYIVEHWLDVDDPTAWVDKGYEMPNPRLAQSINDQLHTYSAAGLPANIDDPQFVMVAEWDGKSPYVICHKGDYSARTMEYAGWPDLTKEQFDAIPADLPL